MLFAMPDTTATPSTEDRAVQPDEKASVDERADVKTTVVQNEAADAEMARREAGDTSPGPEEQFHINQVEEIISEGVKVAGGPVVEAQAQDVPAQDEQTQDVPIQDVEAAPAKTSTSTTSTKK